MKYFVVSSAQFKQFVMMGNVVLCSGGGQNLPDVAPIPAFWPKTYYLPGFLPKTA